jgi:hypothetical protein
VQDTCSYCTQYGDTDNETMRQSSGPTNIDTNLYGITMAAGFDPIQKLARQIRWSARCWFFVYKQFTCLHNKYHVPDLLLLAHALQLRTPLVGCCRIALQRRLNQLTRLLIHGYNIQVLEKNWGGTFATSRTSDVTVVRHCVFALCLCVCGAGIAPSVLLSSLFTSAMASSNSRLFLSRKGYYYYYYLF